MSEADFAKKLLTFRLTCAILIKVLKLTFADVAELADARDLKSRGKRFPCRFDPGHRHHKTPAAIRFPGFLICL